MCENMRIVVSTWKQLNCLLTRDWVNKVCCVLHVFILFYKIFIYLLAASSLSCGLRDLFVAARGLSSCSTRAHSSCGA